MGPPQVQRPGLASLIALDMYILRGAARLGRAALKLRSDLPSILDEFAARLFEEIDYNQARPRPPRRDSPTRAL